MKKKILVGYASCGIAAGAGKVYEVFKEFHDKNPDKTDLIKTGCMGMCYEEPVVEIQNGNEKTIYVKVDEKKAVEIIEKDISGSVVINDYAIEVNGVLSKEAESYLGKQERIVLRNCGVIDPESIDDYIKQGGYQAIKKVLSSMTPDEVIKEIKDSGLKGRGGAGFPTGLKWEFARRSPGTEKYLICNADEGDPGAFMDRSVLESDPHSVIEGMLIAGYAIGADTAYIYVRAEYPLAVKRLRIAIQQAEKKKLLGKKISKDFSFVINLFEGAGAFVCGEETALMGSIMGKRGMPTLRPPFPAVSGLWKKPSNINNVETYANVPWIINKGSSAFQSFGTEKSKGTKVFALAGKVKRGGLIEVPMGISLKEVIFDIAGGIKKDKKFKAVQLGGPSGGCIPADLLDTPVDYDSINKTGAIMGSGGMVVMDEDNCMVDIARFFLQFIQDESCGKCTFCRIGTRRMLEMLEKITKGHGMENDIEELRSLAVSVKQGSLCGLGQTAPNPVLTTLKYFIDEYKAHVLEKRCPSGSCRALIEFRINAEKCTGCTLCARFCPVKAIEGEAKKVHSIISEKCIRCGICHQKCKFNAVNIYSAGILVK